MAGGHGGHLVRAAAAAAASPSTPHAGARHARSQNAQSAAPPAMVPSKYGLISMIFFTVPLAMYGPCVERESTDTMTPPAKGGRGGAGPGTRRGARA